MQEQLPNSRVRVAIRVRPFIAKEIANTEDSCVCTTGKTSIILGRDREFKFDRIFDQNSQQSEVYIECVHQLVMRCFDGYNAAILAYGQTGSGKTYTMGTSHGYASCDQELGILPRVINSLYQEMQRRETQAQFTVRVSFLQIYNEQINDLLFTDSKLKGRAAPTVVQDKGNISIVGLTEETVSNSAELMSILEKGALQRSTSSTLMNDTSSRSHAIFTISIKQQAIVDGTAAKQEGCVTAKFHFVDLAGSERIKKTGATGSTLREGININMGLLCLGNVINALTNPQSKNNFVPYRDSKLTRILQDSLGGNSNTYMIACVSPAESNYEESSSTLRYAARAMNIKNKPIVNRDPQSAMIAQLRQQVTMLTSDNLKCRGMLKQAGIKVEQMDQTHLNVQVTSAFSTINSQELQSLRTTNQTLEKKLEQLHGDMLKDRKRLNGAEIQLLEMRRDRDILKLHLDDILKQHPQIQIPDIKDRADILDGYLQMIQQLKNDITDKDKVNQQLQGQYQQLLTTSKRDEEIFVVTTKQNYRLKRQVIDLYVKRSRESAPIQDQNNTTFMEGASRLEHPEQQMQEQLESDGMYASREKQFETHAQTTQQQISNMHHTIIEKEKLLRDMTNNQIDLEYRLISDMKQQYHNKIRSLEREKERLEKQMQQQMQKNVNTKDETKDRLVVTLKTKRDSLELQLKEYKKKQKDQQNLEKLVNIQKTKIKELSIEIKSFKTQKLQLNRKLKDEKEMFDKFKLQRLKEVLEMKKRNIQKDNFIRKLTIENKRTLQSVVKKDEETRRLKRVNDTLKEIIQPKNLGRVSYKRATVMPHLQHAHQGATTPQHDNIDYNTVVHNIVYKLMCEADLQAEISRYEQQIDNIEKELDKYLQRDTKLKLDMERLKVKKEHFSKEIDDPSPKIEECRMKMTETALVIENLQENLEYTRSRYQTLIKSDQMKFDVETELIYNKTYDSMESMRKIVITLLGRIIETIREQIKEKEANTQLKLEVTSLKSSVEEREQQLQSATFQYTQNLQKLRNDMLIHASYSHEELQVSQIHQKAPKIEQKGEKKVMERKINDLNKKVKHLTMELDHSKRKCEVVAQKYENIKKISNKDKFIGRITSRQDEEIRLTTFSQKRLERANTSVTSQNTTLQQNNVILDEVTNMMQNLSNQTHNSSLSTKQSYSEKEECVKVEQTGEESFQGNYFWESMASFEGHSNPVLSLTCHSNMLISTSMKNLKLWDLQTNKIISDLTGNYLNGYVKCVVVEPEKRIMVTACDKAITLWDLVSLQVISTLKAHKDEVRVLHIANDLLFSAGKGSASASSIFSWDFRSMNPLQEAERSQDIFSLSSNKGVLYYGSRNHQVRRLNMENMEVLAPFEPPHFDTVTCLASMGDYVISGSKDKNLKLWSVQSAVKNLKSTSYAHNDYVNTLSAGTDYPLFYSGSRNGQVKVGTIVKEKIEFLGNIDCHTQSVNSLCIIQESNSSVFATGSADKTIKLWRPTYQTQSLLNNEQFYLSE